MLHPRQQCPTMLLRRMREQHNFCLLPASSDAHISICRGGHALGHETRAIAIAAKLGYMWLKSKQVERAACDRHLADMGTVLQYRDKLAEIGPVLTKDGAGRWCGHAQCAALCPAAAAGVADCHGGRPRDCNPGVAETLEKRVRDVETFVAVVDKLESRWKKKQLEVQLEQLSDFVKERQLVVAELAEKLLKRVRVVEKQLERQAVRGHAELSVLQGHDSRFTNLEQRGDDTAEAINDAKDRVTTLEQYCRRWVRRQGARYKYPAGMRRTASSHWRRFLLATETGVAVPQTQFIDRVVVLPVVL